MSMQFINPRILSVPHFDGKKFYNPTAPSKGLKDVIRWIKQRKPQKWPKWIETAYAIDPLQHVFNESLVITVINHATVLIQTAGKNILTDPVWSYRIGLTPWLGMRRIRPPAITLQQLPPIDYILLSHDHYDHLDLPSLRYLVKRDNPQILCGLGVDKHIRFAKTKALDWWQSITLDPILKFTFTPAQHFSGRLLHDRNTTLWGGFVIETLGGPVYFAGDTGFGWYFTELYQQFGAMRAALLPIGAYEPRWFMGSVHIDPTEAVKIHQILNSQLSIAIHFGTFPLADEGYEAPLEELAKSRQEAAVTPEAFQIPEFGTPISVPCLS